MKFRTNEMALLALKYTQTPEPIDNETISKFDMTEVFYKELKEMLINRESINININGKVRSGKSTTAIALGLYIQTLMNEMKITEKKFDIHNIARTQYELSKKMREPDLNNEILVIDEQDDLEETGVNATVEDALLKNFSKIQAGRYVHRIYCSPADTPDRQSDIVLAVMQQDKKTFMTHCRLCYRVTLGDREAIQLLGYVNISVYALIKNWVTNGIEKRFYMQSKKESDVAFIEKCRKEDFYVEYMCRKFEKMDMINRLGIFRTKELDYADIYLKTIRDLKPLAKLKGVLNNKIIKSHVQMLCRREKIPTSIIGDQLMTEKPESVLNLYVNYFDTLDKYKRITQMTQNGKMSNDSFVEESIILKDAMTKLGVEAKEQERELEFLSELKRKYYGKE